jgi:tetratricopeptide (TPR) repeat protein
MKRLKYISLILLMLAFGCSRDPQVLKRKYVEQGNKYFNNGKYKEAVLLYRKAVQADALFGEAYYREALAELKLGRYSDAVRSLRRTVELQPENQDAAGKLADIYLAATVSGRNNKALIPELKDLAARLLKRDPKSFQGLRINGYLALQDRNLKEAISQFQAAQAVKPFQPDLVVILSQSLVSNNQPADGEKLLKELINKEKSYGPAYDVLYLLYARQKRIDEAEQVVKSKIASNPKQGTYRIQLAGHYLAVGKRQEMLGAIKELTSNTKDFPNAYLLAGDFFYRIRELDLARQQYEAGGQAFPEQKHTYQKRVIETLVAQNRPAEALPLTEQILKEDSKDQEAIAMRASLWLTVGKREQVQTAINDLQSVVTRMPENPVVRFNLARALLAKGDAEAARVQLREAIKLRPDYIPPRFTLAQLHLAKQEFPGALEQAAAIQSVAPSNLQARLIRTSALIGMNSNDQARQEILATLKAAPESRDAQFQLGMLNFREKKFAEAEPIFRRLHDMTPPDPRGLPGIVEVSIAVGKFDSAFDVIRKEIQRMPDRMDLHLMLGNTAARAQQYDTALSEYQLVLAKNPGAGDVH